MSKNIRSRIFHFVLFVIHFCASALGIGLLLSTYQSNFGIYTKIKCFVILVIMISSALISLFSPSISIKLTLDETNDDDNSTTRSNDGDSKNEHP